MDRQDRPDSTNLAWNKMQSEWEIVRVALEGTLALRAAGQTYLPRFPAEPPQKYSSRLATSVYLGVYPKTIAAMVGLVFKKDVNLGDDVPAIIKTHAENINNAGMHLSVFAKELFKKAFEGHVFILVDMPARDPNIKTLAEEKAAGLRPYWVMKSASEAINWRTASINGQTVLTQITFKESTTEPFGDYGEQLVTRYRVWQLLETSEGFRAAWKVLREDKDTEGASIFITESNGVTSLNRIPIAVVYGEHKGYLESKPPLLDLALLNIKHYQKQSDYENTLHLAGMPILCAKDLKTKDGTIPIGTDILIEVGKDGHVWFAEPTGASLGSARTSLADDKEEMAMLGLSMLAPKPKGSHIQTATESVLDTAQETSDLAAMARNLQDGLESALSIHASYLGLTDGGSAQLGVDFSSLVLSDTRLQLLAAMEKDSQITLDTLLWNLNSAELLRPDVSPEQEKTDLEQKRSDAAKLAAERLAAMGSVSLPPPNPQNAPPMVN